jgi:hypothetical protein
LETESAAADMVNLPAGKGRIKNSNMVTVFEAITGRNTCAPWRRIANAECGFNHLFDAKS